MRAPDRTLLALAGLALAAVAAAQTVPVPATPPATLPEADLYRREVFAYQAGGRPDPFQPLLGGDEMGVRVQDLRLVGIIYSGNPRASTAIFLLPDTTQRVRLRTGQRLGSVTVVGIHPRRVDVREDELGVSRLYSLELQRPPRPQAQPGAAPAAPPPAPPPAQPQPQPGQRPR